MIAYDKSALKALRLSGATVASLAVRYDVSENTIRCRLYRMKITLPLEMRAAQRLSALNVLVSDPDYGAKRKDADLARWTPEARAAQADALRIQNYRRFAWCPAELRREYHRLVRYQHFAPADARRIIEDEIDRKAKAKQSKPRLSFEELLAAVTRGEVTVTERAFTPTSAPTYVYSASVLA
jgi:hypothetical protein